MSNNFGYLDIILLAMIAGFIILRLRNILGRKTGHQEKVYSDFSDKNKMVPIRLNDSAKNEIIKYRFPGNIRELKNLAEQISILEINRDVNKETLKKYLPNNSSLPIIQNSFLKNESNENYNERDLLYKILFFGTL